MMSWLTPKEDIKLRCTVTLVVNASSNRYVYTIVKLSNIANCRIKHSICKIKVLYCYSFILRIKI